MNVDASSAQLSNYTERIVVPRETTFEHEATTEIAHIEPTELKQHRSYIPAKTSITLSDCFPAGQSGQIINDARENYSSDQSRLLPEMNSSNEILGSTLEVAIENDLFEHMGPPIDMSFNYITEDLNSYPDYMPQDSIFEDMRSLQEDATITSDNETFVLPPESNTDLNQEKLWSTLEDAKKNSSIAQMTQSLDYATKDSSIERLEPPMEGTVTEATLGNVKEQCKDEISDSSRLLPSRKETPSARLSKRTPKLQAVGGSDRVLRSKLEEKSEADGPSNNVTKVSAGKEKKITKKSAVKAMLEDEYSRIRKKVKYFVSRMSYEQNFIDAYSGEGWKRRSVDKLKPEKELQRAASEIFRCKLRIRDMIQNLDSLCAEGRLPELFNFDGHLDNKDIFCAKCGSRNLCTGNGIILCDGVCDRGFHQLCIQPALSLEEIPPHDEGWLCPGCDCKDDCIDLLNDSRGTTLCLSDSLEKVFPEVAASSGQSLQEDIFASDDSEDDDYDPDSKMVDEKFQEADSSSDDYDFTSASDEMGSPVNDEPLLGLSSDDSEDDDYNPAAPDHDEMVNKESSISDFTSESEDLDNVDESLSSAKKGRPTSLSLNDKKMLSSESLVNTEGQTDSTLVSGSRRLKRQDYKKLYDDSYTNVPSSSSNDDDWTDNKAPRRRKNSSTGQVSQALPSRIVSNTKIRNNTGGAKHREEAEQSFKRCTRAKLSLDGESNSSVKLQKHSPSTGTKNQRRLGEAITQRLFTSFNENQYPDRITKENLAEELGLSITQVDNWFQNYRWSYRHPSGGAAKVCEDAENKDTSSPQNPTAPDHDEIVNKENSSSDFISEDLDTVNENRSLAEKGSLTSSSLSRKKILSSESLSNTEGQTDSTPVSGSRRLKLLDYKKIYDESYAKTPSSSSDDENWTDTKAPRRRKNNSTGQVSQALPGGIVSNTKIKDNITRAILNEETEQSFKRCTRAKLSLDGESNSSVKLQKHSPSTGTKIQRGLGEAATQRLFTSFNENQYPDRVTKEKLAEELGLSITQVNKWFDNNRWSYRHPSGKAAKAAKNAESKDTNSPQKYKGANCNGIENGESTKVDAYIKKYCSEDKREKRVADEDSSGQKASTQKSRKRKDRSK